MQEIREWYDGPVALSGAISNGVGIAAAQKLGADLAYIGSPFIATHEANASYDYKQMIVDSTAEDIVEEISQEDVASICNGTLKVPSTRSSSQIRNDRLDFFWSGDLAIWR